MQRDIQPGTDALGYCELCCRARRPCTLPDIWATDWGPSSDSWQACVVQSAYSLMCPCHCQHVLLNSCLKHVTSFIAGCLSVRLSAHLSLVAEVDTLLLLVSYSIHFCSVTAVVAQHYLWYLTLTKTIYFLLRPTRVRWIGRRSSIDVYLIHLFCVYLSVYIELKLLLLRIPLSLPPSW